MIRLIRPGRSLPVQRTIDPWPASGGEALAPMRAGRRTNLALLGGLLLSPWKSSIGSRALARRPPRPASGAGIGLAVLVAVALLTGFGHSTGLLRSLGPVTAMQVHVGAALACLPLAIWHVVARPQRPRRTDLGRRGLLRAGALAGAAALGWAATEALERVAGLPGARRRLTGSFAAGAMDPAAMPVTQWLDDPVPSVDAAGWRLRVRAGGEVRDWSYQELDAFSDRLRATIDCTGGWYAEQEWQGVWLDRLLPGHAGPGSVVVSSLTGYQRRFPSRERGRLLVATRVGGRPLADGHGFPARIVAPGGRGFWWVKWLDEVAIEGGPWWWQPPFPLT
jgi:hypothetical protein